MLCYQSFGKQAALTKTNRGLLAISHAAWATALHYACSQLCWRDKPPESARGDWERDVARSGAFEGGRDTYHSNRGPRRPTTAAL